ncbi:MAG TPA: FUSC family protein [Xanthobacteraceae bacterium]|nr:FUSC family protein [Xanthobacteraceae bacterium]
MNDLAGWTSVRRWIGVYKPRWRFCVRMTASGLAAFAVARLLAIPLQGLWVIITAIVVTQMSAGGSLRATLEYIVGTVGGAVYAAFLGAFVPHDTVLSQAGILVLAIAPLALLAAFNPNFRVAPFSAVLVILISGQFGEGPVESAITRSSEVALGGVIAVIVSLVVFPERAHNVRLKAAARLLRQFANALPELLTGFTRGLNPAANSRIQNDIGAAVAGFQQITTEAEHELLLTLAAQPDPGPLSRTILRLRHDLVIIGRAGVKPLPDALRGRLAPLLTRVGAAAHDFLDAAAAALDARNGPPSVEGFEAALAAYIAEVEAMRGEGLTLPLTSNEVEPVFALGFALEQLRQNFIDLRRCVRSYARRTARQRRT